MKDQESKKWIFQVDGKVKEIKREFDTKDGPSVWIYDNECNALLL
jgi:hypothetical protein